MFFRCWYRTRQRVHCLHRVLFALVVKYLTLQSLGEHHSAAKLRRVRLVLPWCRWLQGASGSTLVGKAQVDDLLLPFTTCTSATPVTIPF